MGMRILSGIFGIIISFLAVGLIPETAFAEAKHNIGSHGYFRYNLGLAEGNEDQVDFQAPGAGAKYRYGNETLSYGEISLYDTYELNGDVEGGLFIHAEAMINVTQDEPYGDFDIDTFEEFYLEAGNFTKAFGNPRIWAGRRFFLDRYTIHINDYAYLSTSGGFADGLGIRGIDAGPGRLALMVNRSSADSAAGDNIFQTNVDVRLSDIEVNEDGKLMLWGLFSTSSSKGMVESTTGWAAGIMHTQTNVLGGYNRFMVQYGSGLGRAAGTTGKDDSLGQVTSADMADDLEDAKTFRIIDELVIEPNSYFGLMTSLVYEDKDSEDFDNIDQTWISAGVRPYWYVTDNFRIPLEIGYDYVDNKAADTSGSLLKTTLAAEFAMERGVWTRPVLRAYVTHANWSDDFVGQIGGDTFVDDDSGLTAGVQIEYWW